MRITTLFNLDIFQWYVIMYDMSVTSFVLFTENHILLAQKFTTPNAYNDYFVKYCFNTFSPVSPTVGDITYSRRTIMGDMGFC